MAFNEIDKTTPAGNEKKKFGDDRIREFKIQVIDNLTEISNYPASTMPALKTAVWTTATRPSGTELVDRVSGYNTDLGCEEYYDLYNNVWRPKVGLPRWNVSDRPTIPINGMVGFNTDLWVQECWNSSTGKWDRVSGNPRGFIDKWSGSVANIPTGWVLADGDQRTHPEGGTFKPPDLRKRFIVGAGDDAGVYTPGIDGIGTGNYAPGATGGEDKHTQIIDEMPSHYHTYTAAREGYGGMNRGGYAALGNGTWNSSSSGGGQAHENRPPYYALCFLYKL